MPVWLIVTLCIIAFAAFLLICPITVTAQYNKSLKLRVSYLFFVFKFPKQKKGKKAKSKAATNQPKAKQKSKSNNIFAKAFKKEGVSGFLNLLKNLAAVLQSKIKQLFSHIIIKQLDVKIAACGDDAAAAAVNYGYVCMAAYPAFAAINQILTVKQSNIEVAPDFTEGKKSEVLAYCKLRIMPFWALAIALSGGFAFAKAVNN
jgi:hypothetical protein